MNLQIYVIFISFLNCTCNIITYKGDRVYRITLNNKTDANHFLKFYKITKNMLDYWQVELHAGGHVDVRVTLEKRHFFLEHEFLRGLHVEVKIQDVEELLEETEFNYSRRKRSTNSSSLESEKEEEGERLGKKDKEIKGQRKGKGEEVYEEDESEDNADLQYDYNKYNNAAATHREMYRLAHKYPNITRLIAIGATYGNRPLIVMEIEGMKKKNRPVVWVDGGLHAREWITVASTMYFINKLLEGYGKNGFITDILDSVKLAVQPLSNPDGYAYSWNKERLWRKNRAPTKVAWCKGVDLNRNFDVNFGGTGASDFSCSEIYSGKSPFSENESQSMARYLASVRHQLMAYFSLHSYGQMWLTPLSYTRRKVADRSKHMEVAEYATQTIKKLTGHKYVYGPATSLMYLTSGDSSDWVYTNLNCSHTYGIELRDSGRYGFLLPESQIVATGKETLAGILAAVERISTQPFNYTRKFRRQHRRRRKKFLS